MEIVYAAAEGAASNGQGGSLAGLLFPLILMVGVFYFLLIRPQQQQRKRHEELLSQLKKGDKVITTGGIIGTLIGIDSRKAVIKVGDENTKLELLRSAIAGRYEDRQDMR